MTMNKTILALAILGISSAGAIAAEPLRLSEVPPGAIHTPGIGPGYIYPVNGDDIYPVNGDDMTGMGASTMPATAMVPGTIYIPEDEPAMGMSQAGALGILREQGFTNVRSMRQAPDGSWHGLAVQPGGTYPVSVNRDGVVSFREQ